MLENLSNLKGKKEVKSDSKPQIEVYDPITDINKKFDIYIKFVVGILLVAVITMLIMVGTLVVDSFHFNSVTYKEYSSKMDSYDLLLKQNKELMEENKKTQDLINMNQQLIINLVQNNSTKLSLRGVLFPNR